MKNTEKAFRWIIEILRQNNIPFQISGGLAARIYGADRPLYDIDIDIEGKNFPNILKFVKEYIISGPEHHKDDAFDLDLLTLEYMGQQIDLGSSENAKMYNKKEKRWQECKIDYNNFVEHEIYGLTVPVIKPENLIEYKNIIGRPTDVEDVEFVRRYLANNLNN